jgi:hypothetical protein
LRPTADDFEPRRDRWFEHKGTWQEVTVGTVIASRKRTERWEIIAQSHGHQVEYGHTLWMRARDQVSGAEYTVEPRVKTSPVTILTQDPADYATAPPTPPTDSESIALLVEKLGAQHLATRDHVTGEITCPYYAAGENHLDEAGNGALRRGEAEHLRFAHAMVVPENAVYTDIRLYHDRAHDPAFPDIGKGGFPHRHVPEDLSYL